MGLFFFVFGKETIPKSWRDIGQAVQVDWAVKVLLSCYFLDPVPKFHSFVYLIEAFAQNHTHSFGAFWKVLTFLKLAHFTGSTRPSARLEDSLENTASLLTLCDCRGMARSVVQSKAKVSGSGHIISAKRKVGKKQVGESMGSCFWLFFFYLVCLKVFYLC